MFPVFVLDSRSAAARPRSRRSRPPAPPAGPVLHGAVHRRQPGSIATVGLEKEEEELVRDGLVRLGWARPSPHVRETTSRKKEKKP